MTYACSSFECWMSMFVYQPEMVAQICSYPNMLTQTYSPKHALPIFLALNTKKPGSGGAEGTPLMSDDCILTPFEQSDLNRHAYRNMLQSIHAYVGTHFDFLFIIMYKCVLLRY